MTCSRIVIVQHCQSEHHVHRAAGVTLTRRQWFNSNLTELGRRQAEAVARRLAERLQAGACALFSSDMPRALQTAQVLAGVLHVEPRPSEGLREWAGVPTPTDQPDPPTDPDQPFSLFDWREFPTGQTWREFHQRVCTCMDELTRDGALPIVVTHGGTASCIVAWWLRLPVDVLPERTPFAGLAGSITVLRRTKHGNPVIGRLNDTSHLEAAGLTSATGLGWS